MSEETSPVVRYAVDDGIATITLNRPERLNAFTVAMVGEVVAAIDRAERDGAVRVLVFTGAGKAYSVGSDLSGGADTFDYDALGVNVERGFGPENAPPDMGGFISLRLYDCHKPVIVAFNGTAAGVGLTMALPADIRLASTEAKFCFPFVRRGIAPESASSWFLPRIVGIARAQEWMLTGRVFSATEALAGGLVRSLHPPDEVLPAAIAIAREIADLAAPVSVALAKQMLWRMLEAPHPRVAHELDSRAVYATGRSADAREGVGSFLEKRPARFIGRVPDDLPPFVPWWT